MDWLLDQLADLPRWLTIIIVVVLLLNAVLWFFLPWAVFGIKGYLQDQVALLKKQVALQQEMLKRTRGEE